MTFRPMDFEIPVILQSMKPPSAQLTSKVIIEAAPYGRDESSDWPAGTRNAAIYTSATTPHYLPCAAIIVSTCTALDGFCARDTAVGVHDHNHFFSLGNQVVQMVSLDVGGIIGDCC